MVSGTPLFMLCVHIVFEYGQLLYNAIKLDISI